MKFGIFPKLLMTMIVVAVIPLGAVWYLNHLASLNRLNHDIDQRLSAQSDAIVRSVDDWVEMNLKVLRQTAALDDIAAMDARRQKPILRSITNEYQWTYLAFTIGLNGMNVGRSDDKEPINYADRVYVIDVLKGAPLGKQVLISRTTGQPSFILSVPITARQQLAGVLALGTSVEQMAKHVTNVPIGRTGYAFLLDDAGNVIGHPNKDVHGKSLSNHPTLTGLAGDSRKKRLEYAEASGKKVIAYAQKTKYGWTAAVQQDVDEAYAPISEANRYAVLTLAATVIVVGGVSYLLAQRFARPIRNLTEITEGISRGKLDAAIGEVNRSDEIGDLGRAIERLKTSVRLAIERLSKR